MIRSPRVAPLLAAALVAGILGGVHVGQRLIMRWIEAQAQVLYLPAQDYFTAERIDALLATAAELAADDGLTYQIKLSNAGTASVTLCYPDERALTFYTVLADNSTIEGASGASCVGGFDAGKIGAEPMLGGLRLAVDPSFTGRITASYNAMSGLTPIVDIAPENLPLQRFTISGERIGEIIDPHDPIDLQFALEELIQAANLISVQRVCVNLMEPELSVEGSSASNQPSGTAMTWRFVNFPQRMPSVTADFSVALTGADLNFAELVTQASGTLANLPPGSSGGLEVKLWCVEAGEQLLVRYELMNRARATVHQLWMTLDGIVTAYE